MFEVLGSNGSLRIVELKAAGTSDFPVSVAGSFNDWDPSCGVMEFNPETKVYHIKLRLAPGYYEYKFVIRGNWELDTTNPDFAANDFGTLNSVINLD